MSNEEIDLDKLFCMNSKKYGLPKLYIKAVATVESSLDPRAYRYEQGFWDRYLANNPLWMNKEPHLVSASYGLMQIMYVVAYENGFKGEPEDLYNPVYNIPLGTKILAKHIQNAEDSGVHVRYKIWPLMIAAARYNGGSRDNPGTDGRLRNQPYVNKVWTAWNRLIKTEKECEEPA